MHVLFIEHTWQKFENIVDIYFSILTIAVILMCKYNNNMITTVTTIYKLFNNNNRDNKGRDQNKSDKKLVTRSNKQ